ncbi:MAG: dienelactone hydrolase family protein [Pseudonocardiaceae bacterium]
MTRTGKKAISSSHPRSHQELSRPGPHRVLRGDLTLIGMPGVVFTPESGLGLPAVAFGHGWLQPTWRYEELLCHLASWGVVTAAPATQGGALPSHRQFATDLRTVLELCIGVRLGDGQVSVDAGRLGMVGHGMGGGAAVLAAADDERCQAVATLALAQTLPSAVDAATQVGVPGMHLAGGKDRVAPAVGHAEPVAKAWVGPVQLRILPKASHLGFTQGRHWSDLVLDGSPEHPTRRISRALVTTFLLRHLTGATEFDNLLDADLPGAPLTLTH